MRRGEIYYADLSPFAGDEINKRRPVLSVSNGAVLPIKFITRLAESTDNLAA
jgi:mRNA-degrading endonuclease toxin of MazEF toxin-antitoxin module